MTGQQLIDRIVAWLRAYVVLTEQQALVVALWALNTWVYEKFAAVPYLEIWATGKRSGKSTLAEMLSAVSRAGRVLPTVRAISMARAIEATDGAYTAFVEEAERFSSPRLGDERAILATGYRRGATHEVTTPKGEILQFRTFCPKAFVLICNVHEILRDRCISIKLERSIPSRNWTAERDFAAAAEAAAILEAWHEGTGWVTKDGEPHITPVVPDWLASARDREIWTPLFSLAHALKLHKDTVSLLKRASVDLSWLKTQPATKYNPWQDEPVNEDANAAEAVLADMISVFAEGEDRITTDDMVQRLHNIDVAGWRSWRGAGLDPNALGRLLDRFGVGPKDLQFGKGRKGRKILKGYALPALRKAYADHVAKK